MAGYITQWGKVQVMDTHHYFLMAHVTINKSMQQDEASPINMSFSLEFRTKENWIHF